MKGRKKMKKSEIILTVILILVTLGVVVTIVITAINANKNPDTPVDQTGVIDTVKPEPDVTTPEPPKDDTSKPEIPSDTMEPNNGEVKLDVGEKNDNGHEDAPGIVGDVVVVPGIKDESEGD